MKMKKILLACLLSTGWTQAQNITFKDPEFKNVLLNIKILQADDNNYDNIYLEDLNGNKVTIDQNNDNEISVQEALNVGYIKYHTLYNENKITDLSDLSSFANLIGFETQYSKISKVDLSLLSKLKVFYCPYSNLSAIDVTNNLELEQLNISNSLISNLDISKNSKLKVLDFSFTDISSVDVTDKKELNGISVSDKIKTLDLSKNPKMDSIYLGSNVEFANIKNGSTLSLFRMGIPNTHSYICADDNNIPLIEQALISDNYQKVQVNSYCTFEPGGVYNKISGKLIFSLNGDCSNGVNNLYISGNKINIDDQKSKVFTLTDSDGNYNFIKQKGVFTITPNLELNQYYKVTPEISTFKLKEDTNHDTIVNFCITPVGIHKDLEIVIAPFGCARPGFQSLYQVTYKNKGNQTLSGDINVTYNKELLNFDIVYSPTFLKYTDGVLSTKFIDLKPFESRTEILSFTVNSPVQTPAVNIGDKLKFVTTITPSNEDETPEDNVFELNQTVVGAYDPNLIMCLQGNELKPSEIGKTLHYTIEFENTGNYPAENIVVVEEIDPKKYDINSLQILNTSHPMKFRMEGNKVEYYFEDIKLGEHKHGNILLKLKSYEGLTVGSEVDKQANIYFDYNAPVQTNNEKTIYQDLKASISELKEDVSIHVYPNPGNGIVHVKADKNIKSINMYDVNGRVIQSKIVNSLNVELQLTDEITGVYFVKVITEEGANVIKYQKD
jgi:hypothetical protein